MHKKYLNEVLIVLVVAFMSLYPPDDGVMLFFFAATGWLGYQGIQAYDRKKSPQLAKLEAEFGELKTKVEQLILRGNR